MDDLGFRLLEAHPGLMQDRTEVSLDESVLRRYVGQYFLRPGAVYTVALEDGKLSVFMRGQGKSVMYPESETEFFCKARDVQVTFVLDGSGNVTEMIHHAKGRDKQAKRLPDAP